MKFYFRIGLLPLFLFICVFSTTAQVSLTQINVASTQNFDNLANAGTNIAWMNNITLPGWYSSRTTYNAGDGSVNTGALYSFGSTASPERALGAVASGGTGTVLWGVRLQNNSGIRITSLDLSFFGEQWRDGGAATPVAQTLTFDYRTSDSANPITDLTTGIYTADSAFNFVSPTFVNTGAGAATDGNAAANRIGINGTLAVTLNVGDEIMLRWTDINNAGNDHGLAIDGFSVTSQVVVTAGNVTISGRAVTSSGRGISDATVTLFGGNLPGPLAARTSSFGYYSFDGVAAGQTYVLSIGSKRYLFTNPTITVTATDDLDDQDFVAEP